VEAADILILSNGPGEVTTWVRPVVCALRETLGCDRTLVRISVILSPCPNATGREAAIAKSYPEVDRVQGAEHFFGFLLWGKTAENWDWRDKGVVVFLGGDQFFPVIIGKRLGYRTVIYAEWDARWHAWIDRFAVMQPKIINNAPKQHVHKLTVVGDLMADVGSRGAEGQKSRGAGEQRSRGAGEQRRREEISDSQFPQSKIPSTLSASRSANGAEPLTSGGNLPGASYVLGKPQNYAPARHCQNPKSKIQNPKSQFPTSTELIGLLPGSKPAKLAQGVPLALAIAEHIHAIRPQTRFVIPVAPTLDLATLERFADPQHNPIIDKLGWARAQLTMPSADTQALPFLKTPSGLRVELWESFPAHDLLRQCRLCLTTVGANTAELGSLAVPMLVLLPTQQLDAMRSWDGLPGLLVRLPGVGASFAKAVNWLVLNWLVRRRGHLFAWPNKWANEAIVPELVGQLQPTEIAKLALDYLEHPEKLEAMRSRLRHVRGSSGAARKLAQIVQEELDR
jgi:lipid-A-disaccharide synthase